VEKRKIKHHSQMRRTLQLKRIEYRKKIKRLTNFNDIKLFFGNKKIGGLPIFLCRFDFSKIRII
jgi:hypothetical protein